MDGLAVRRWDGRQTRQLWSPAAPLLAEADLELGVTIKRKHHARHRLARSLANKTKAALLAPPAPVNELIPSTGVQISAAIPSLMELINH